MGRVGRGRVGKIGDAKGRDGEDLKGRREWEREGGGARKLNSGHVFNLETLARNYSPPRLSPGVKHRER